MKLSAQCLAQSAMGALAQTTLLWYLARSLGPLLLIPSFTTSTSIGSSQRTPGLLPSPYPGVFFAKTTLSFFWLQTECPDTFTAGTRAHSSHVCRVAFSLPVFYLKGYLSRFPWALGGYTSSHSFTLTFLPKMHTHHWVAGTWWVHL